MQDLVSSTSLILIHVFCTSFKSVPCFPLMAAYRQECWMVLIKLPSSTLPWKSSSVIATSFNTCWYVPMSMLWVFFPIEALLGKVSSVRFYFILFYDLKCHSKNLKFLSCEKMWSFIGGQTGRGFSTLLKVLSGGCARYTMASKVPCELFWLGTQVFPQSDWAGWSWELWYECTGLIALGQSERFTFGLVQQIFVHVHPWLMCNLWHIRPFTYQEVLNGRDITINVHEIGEVRCFFMLSSCWM